MSCSKIARLGMSLDALESRELLSGDLVVQEDFDRTDPPGLPTGWVQWTDRGLPGFTSTADQGYDQSGGLASDGLSNQTARVWWSEPTEADVGVGATVLVSTLVPVRLLARGQNLDSSAPSYYAVELTRGTHIELLRVVDGEATTLARLNTDRWLSGEWLDVTLTLTGPDLQVEVIRSSTGEYLNGVGTWQTDPARAIRVADAALPSGGRAGIERTARYAGPVHLDHVHICVPSAEGPVSPRGREDFDTAPIGGVPSGWSEWANLSGMGFEVRSGNSVSGNQALASVGASFTAARAWVDEEQPADVEVSVSVQLNSLIPAQVFLRGSDLDTRTPSYYAATMQRGAVLEIVRVVEGKTVTLAELKTAEYFSGTWVRLYFAAEGEQLELAVQRLDSEQWLSPQGTWQSEPTLALQTTDTTLTGPGQVGLARPRQYWGNIYFDDFAYQPDSSVFNTPPSVSIEAPGDQSSVSGTVAVQVAAADDQGIEQVELYLGSSLLTTLREAPYHWDFATTAFANGTYTLEARAYDLAGQVTSAQHTVVIDNPTSNPGLPDIPRNYDHIRIAQLAYAGNPLEEFEQQLLRESVDLVIPNTRYLEAIDAQNPDTPQLIYTNLSNVYLDLLTDWLAYADAHGYDREQAFYHVATATPFQGSSPSSIPVTWFWNARAGEANPENWADAMKNVLSQSRGTVDEGIVLGPANQALYLGYPEKFREVNLSVEQPPGTGWTMVVEYVTAVDAQGHPSAWQTLTLLQDSSDGLTQSGQLRFDPPADWVPSSIGGSASLYHLRLRTLTGAATEVPVLGPILGRDYVQADGAINGLIPAFDATADLDEDGYLNDAEYAQRLPGKDARFVYESRLFYPYYGQQRFITRPDGAGFRRWAADYHVRYLQQFPLADGLFVDNSNGKLPIDGIAVLESTDNYARAAGELLEVVGAAVAPKWLMANTAGGFFTAQEIVPYVPATLEEFALRPQSATWSQFLDIANLVATRQAAASPTPYLVLDSLAQGSDPTDPRFLMSTLAYYYLLGNPETTFLMFSGGDEPASSWTRHWVDAVAYDVGLPTESWSEFAMGQDPDNPDLLYRIYQRSYTNALVLYKPLSTFQGQRGSLADTTATVHALDGDYRMLQPDGTLGSVINEVTLRNGEGVVLIRV